MPSTSIIQALTDKLQTHKEKQFTGIVHIGVGRRAQWSIYFHMGRMVWAHSRTHPVRRWYRQVVKHCSHLLEDFDYNYAALHYSKLVAKVRDGSLNRINLAKAIEDYLSEILFDIIHQGTLRSLQLKQGFTLTDVEKRYASTMFLIVRAEQAWQQALYDWQAWQQAELVKCSPNLAPKIGNAEELKKQTSAPVFAHLTSTIDGEHSFRDLAVKLNQPLLPLTRRIVPYVRQGLMGLIRLEDLVSSPSNKQATASSLQQSAQTVQGVEQRSGQKDRTRAMRGMSSPQQNSSLTDRGTTFTGITPRRKPGTTCFQRPDSYSGATAEALSTTQKSRATTTQINKTPNRTPSNAPLIIYIDDSPMDSRAMGNILQDAGFRFRSIQESTHALPLLIEHKPQLIFLDLVMPVANGYEICSQVRRVSLFKDIPIVIVTSNNSLADRVHAKMVGASGFLSKPINREKVLRTVNKLMDAAESNSTALMSSGNERLNLQKARSLTA